MTDHSDLDRPGPTSRGPGWWRTITTELTWLAVTGAILAITVTVTLVHRHQARALAVDGVPVVVRIGDRHSNTVDVTYRLSGTTGLVTAESPIKDPERLDDTIGYPAVADPDQPERVRLDLEPYDPVEPIVIAALPVAWPLTLIARKRLRWRTARRIARHQPFRPVQARLCYRTRSTAALGLAYADEPWTGPRCIVQIPDRHGHLAGWRTQTRTQVATAGRLEPGHPIALTINGMIVPVAGHATAKTARRRRDQYDSHGHAVETTHAERDTSPWNGGSSIPPDVVFTPWTVPQWAPDPWSHGTFRWWDGYQWTGWIATHGTITTDPRARGTG